MKKSFKNTVFKAIAKSVLKTAEKTCGAASNWDCYQPKEPEALKKMAKKINQRQKLLNHK